VHPDLVHMLMNERVRARQEAAAAWRLRRAYGPIRAFRRPRRQPTWETRTV
jgi:hypothetical protein